MLCLYFWSLFFQGFVNAAEQKLSEKTVLREQAFDRHQSAENIKREARSTLDEEKRTLGTKKNELSRQIETKNGAKRQVERQTKIVEKATLDHTELEGKLAQAKEQQTIKTNEVHQTEIQLQQQTQLVEQLETEVNNLEKNQTQIEQTLGNLNNALRDAQAKHQTAENNLTITNEKLTAKQQNIQETEGLIANKQQEIEAKQAEHAAKQGIA